MAMTSRNRISSRRVASSRRGRGWFFSSSRSGDGGNKNKNTSLRRAAKTFTAQLLLMSIFILILLSVALNLILYQAASASSLLSNLDSSVNNLRSIHQKPNMRSMSNLIPKKVALIVAGTQKRFLFNSTLENVIAPMAREGIEVDYYLSLLTTNKSVAYRSNSYMDHVISESHSMITKPLPDLIQESLSNFASRATVTIQDDINLNLEPRWKEHEEKALREYPLEDPYIRFPMFDSRSEDLRRRTSIGNKNLLKMHFAIKSLWADVLLQESQSGSKYDIVIFMRDDTLWVGEFNIGELLSNGREGDDVFIPSCDGRIPPLHPMEVSDHIIISKRSAADIFGDYYTRLTEVDTHECMSRLDNGVTKNGLRGCNSEMLLKFVLDKEGVRVRKVPQSLIPFQRAVRVKLGDGSAKYCFHKFCQSKSSPLQLTDSIDLCKDIDWN